MKQVISVGTTLGSYSPAILATGSKQVFVSGQIAVDLESDIRTQTRQAIKKIEAVLESVSFYLSDIVKTTLYLTDISLFDTVNREYALFFPSEPPARVTVQVAALPKNALIMIDAIAVRD
ncbi:MAG: RidA family protein [Candidatus Heimdallarchaeota archaeon]